MNKAETLIFLKNNLKSASILPILSITFKSFCSKEYLNDLVYTFPHINRFVIRSSFSQEDSASNSQAGKYKSFINIKFEEIDFYINEVFESYPNPEPNEIIFIQPHLSDSIRSGVLFSHVPSTGQAYVVDSYVLGSDTLYVTSGKGHTIKHTCLRISDKRNEHCASEICQRLKLVVDECVKLLELETLDIEYAINDSNQIYVFQVRSLLIKKPIELNIESVLSETQKYLKRIEGSHPFLSGSRTMFGSMPDWNPAEMIGRRPKPLAISLYRELITDSVWAYQRDNYGYKNLRSFPLLVELNFQPYIDVRVSFNSLLPKGIEVETEEKLVNFYLDELDNNRQLHDKIEFEIVLSSWSFEMEKKISRLPLTINDRERNDIKSSLTKLTQNLILGEKLKIDIKKIRNLSNRLNSFYNIEGDRVRKLFWLLEDCKRWGTLPFSGIARAAFIATDIIRSLERRVGDGNILRKFVSNLTTVTSQMHRDLVQLNRVDFLEKYGHLRPGTYDITSLTYAEAYDIYFSTKTTPTSIEFDSVECQDSDLDELRNYLELFSISKELDVAPKDFLDFASSAIFWREQAKFEFTKNVSHILNLIIEIGNDLGITREELAFLDVRDILSCYSRSINISKVFEDSINRGKKQWEVSSNIELPNLITSVDEIYAFTEEDMYANFITEKVISGTPNYKLEDLEGTIALIESADPGYDWIFGRGILALITAWGGLIHIWQLDVTS